MPKSYFMMEVNTAPESWRTIRSIRADPPAPLREVLAGDRAKVFQMALEQAQQQFTAAGQIGYESRPLNLFYGLSQAGRAIAAASNRLGPAQADDAVKIWKAVGHGLKFKPEIDHSAGLLGAPVKWDPGEKDLFSRVSRALGSPLDFGSAVIGELLSQTPEARLEFGTIGDWLPELHNFGVSESKVHEPGPYLWDVHLPGLPESGDIHEDEVRSVLNRYPALQPMVIETTSDRIAQRSHNPGYFNLQVPSADLLARRSNSSFLLPHGASTYRRHQILLPCIGASSSSLEPLMSWWLVLFALSMVARYSPSDWTEALSISTSPIASLIEHVLDSAVDAVPDLIAEAVTTLNLDS